MIREPDIQFLSRKSVRLVRRVKSPHLAKMMIFSDKVRHHTDGNTVLFHHHIDVAHWCAAQKHLVVCYQIKVLKAFGDKSVAYRREDGVFLGS